MPVATTKGFEPMKPTASRPVRIVTGLIGILLMATFVIGLSHSISTGFAGFKGGLPFAVIVAFVLILVVYDYYDECVRKRDDDPS